MKEHENFMRIAIERSQQAVEHGNHPFAAILVKDGSILLSAENTVDTEHDCTQHAELRLVSQASRKYDGETLSQCILYTSAEPCHMCAGAIYWSGISTVVYGCSDDTLSKYAGKEFSIPCEEILPASAGIIVIGPLLEKEAEEVHIDFSKKHAYKERWG